MAAHGPETHRARQRGRLKLFAALTTIGLVAALAPAAARSDADNVKYYVSIGDSYAAGYRPTGPDQGATSHDGFAYQVQESLSQHGRDWQLVNFGCSGQTAHGMAFDNGCDPAARAPDGAPYDSVPQAVAAADFIAQHRERVGLVTIVVGGNDVVPCLDQPDAAAAGTCLEAKLPDVVLAIDALLARVRAEAGDGVPIVGLSYINVAPADALSQDPAGAWRASASQTMFDNYLNPALLQTYSKYGAHFVDTTSLAGGDLPPSEMTSLPGYGTVPASIGRICVLTYYCNVHDVHPNHFGHALIAGEIQKVVQP